MILDEFRKKMWTYRETADRDANALKESNLVWQWLHDLYQKFDIEERKLADQVLREWVLSEDENLRYDALVLIGDFKIVSALPALRELAVRLTRSKEPSAPHELRKVKETIADFEIKMS